MLNTIIKRVVIVFISVFVLVSLSSCCRVATEYQCGWNPPWINKTDVQPLILPITKLPEGWRTEGSPENDISLLDVYRHSNRVVLQKYAYALSSESNIKAEHIIALYGSEECAKLDMERSATSFPVTEWLPLSNWRYTSDTADSIAYAFFLQYRSSNPADGYKLRVLVEARYGTVISLFSWTTLLEKVTPEQVKSVVIAIDEQFQRNPKLWRR